MAEAPTDVAPDAGAVPTLLEAVANTGLEGAAPTPTEMGPFNPSEPFPQLDHDLMTAFMTFRQNYPQMMAQLRSAANAPPTVAAASAGAPPMDASSSPVVAAGATTVPPPPVVPKTPVIEGKADAPAFPPVPPPGSCHLLHLLPQQWKLVQWCQRTS